MKKILSLILCLAMLLSLGTLAISAEKIDGTTDKVLYAHYGTVTMDGNKDECLHFATYSGANNGADQDSAMFAAAWNAETLYIAMSGDAINTYSHSGRAQVLSRALIYFENGFSVESKADGSVIGDGVTAVRGAEKTITQKNIFGQSHTATGVMYVEFAIPMSKLNFYDMGDGTLATQVSMSYVTTASQWKNVTVTLVLGDDAVVAGRDTFGATANMAEYNADYDFRGNHVNNGMYGSFNTTRSVAYFGFGTKPNNAFFAKPIRTTNGVLMAGVAGSVGVELAFDSLPETTGPVEAEDWVVGKASSANTQRAVSVDNDTTVSNPTRLVLVSKFFENGTNPEALVGYAIYNVGGEYRLYSAAATSAGIEGVDYVVLPGVVAGQGNLDHVNKRNFFNLRLDFDASYNVTVVLNGREVGKLAAPAVTAAASVKLHTRQDSELTIAGISDGTSRFSMHFKAAVVTQQSAEAVAVLAALKNSFFVKGDQNTAVVDGKYSVRFLAVLPAGVADYSALGYDVMLNNNNGSAGTRVDITKVYESVSANGRPITFDGLVSAIEIRGIEVADGDATIKVTPWVVTAKGGEKLYGETYTVTYKWDGETLTYSYDG